MRWLLRMLARQTICRIRGHILKLTELSSRAIQVEPCSACGAGELQILEAGVSREVD